MPGPSDDPRRITLHRRSLGVRLYVGGVVSLLVGAAWWMVARATGASVLAQAAPIGATTSGVLALAATLAPEIWLEPGRCRVVCGLRVVGLPLPLWSRRIMFMSELVRVRRISARFGGGPRVGRYLGIQCESGHIVWFGSVRHRREALPRAESLRAILRQAGCGRT